MYDTIRYYLFSNSKMQCSTQTELTSSKMKQYYYLVHSETNYYGTLQNIWLGLKKSLFTQPMTYTIYFKWILNQDFISKKNVTHTSISHHISIHKPWDVIFPLISTAGLEQSF